MQSKQSSPYKKIPRNTFSIPSQSPEKQNDFQNKPFEFISHKMHYQPHLKPSYNSINQQGYNETLNEEENSILFDAGGNEGKLYDFGYYDSSNGQRDKIGLQSNKFKFQSYDLYKNPMIESIDGDYPQLIESQMINNKATPFLDQFSTNQYALESTGNQQSRYPQNTYFHRVFSPLKSQASQNRLEIQSRNKTESPSQQKISQPYIKTQSNLLSDHEECQWETRKQYNYGDVPLDSSQPSPHDFQQYKFSSSPQPIQILSQHNNHSINNTGNPHVLVETGYTEESKNPAKEPNVKDVIVNEDISEVKYRLDQLMNKFPIQSFQTGKKNRDFTNKKQATEFSAPQLEMRRTNSIDQTESLKIRSKFKEEDSKMNPHTEGKIFISHDHHGGRMQYGSQELLAKNTDSKGGCSLNYSESGFNSATEVYMPKPEIDSLYQHIREQEETIQTYKKILQRLKNQNTHLLSIIEHQSKNTQNLAPNTSHIDPKNIDSLSSQPNQPIQSHSNDRLPNSCLLSNPDSKLNDIPASDSLHKFEKEFNQSQLNISISHNIQKQSNHNKNSKLKSSGRISPSLQQKVDILESQKIQLLKKIDWLNGVVEQMMNMGNKAKSEHSVILDDVQPIYRNPKRARQFSGDLGKVSRIIQTSFIQHDPPGGILEYRELYERQIQHKKIMKNQIHDLLELQNAYSVQFEMILKQIKQIKQNRAYYQELKKEILKSKEKNIIKKTNHASKSPNQQTIKLSGRQIFQNEVIYQLKTENEYLMSQYLKLKHLQSKQKALRNNLNFSTNELKISNHTNQLEESVVAQSEKNVFQGKNFKKKQRVDERQETSPISNIQRERPVSYEDLDFPSINRSKQSRMKSFDNRKNGSIYCSSQVDDGRKSRKRLVEIEKHKHEFNQNNIQNHSANFNNQNYQSAFEERNLSNGKSTSRMVARHGIANEQKERSSNYTHETSQNIIGRYNNFIKNMKQRFGINSSIIGKQIPLH